MRFCRSSSTRYHRHVTRRAWIYFAVVALLWGVPYFFIKVALRDLSPQMVVFVRVAIGAGTLLPVVLLSRGFASLRGRLGWICAYAVLEVIAPFLLISFGEQRITSSLTGILIATEPMFVTLVALRFDPTERVHAGQFLGMLVGLLGVAVLLGVGSQSGGWIAGAAMVIGATLTYALGALVIKHRLSDLSPLVAVTASLSISAVVLAVPAAFALPHSMPSLGTVAALLILGVACTGVAFIAFFSLIGLAGARRATLITYASPVFAVFLGVLAAGDPFTVWTALGLVLVLSGSWFATSAAGSERQEIASGRFVTETGSDGA
jgi:drug/metabolite transporter (DMT)-like permease